MNNNQISEYHTNANEIFQRLLQGLNDPSKDFVEEKEMASVFNPNWLPELETQFSKMGLKFSYNLNHNENSNPHIQTDSVYILKVER